MKDDDVTAAELAGRQRKVIPIRGLLVNQQEVTHQQRRHHGGGGNAKRLNGKGDDEDGDNDDREQRLNRDEQRFGSVVMVCGGSRERWRVDGRAAHRGAS